MNDIKWVSIYTIKYSLENRRRAVIKLRNIFEQSLLTNINEITSLIN